MDNRPAHAPERHAIEEPPPFLGSWPRVYVAVLVYLCALIGLFYTFSRTFTP